MKNTVLALVVTVLGLGSVAFAGNQPVAAQDNLNLIHTADLQKALADKAHPVAIFDANNQTTRTENGVIPGAKLLPNSSHYDLALLPQDKTASLVFYCANTECTASHTAAKRAITAGYKNVSVFADGIQGWKQAGLKTTGI